jgi:hypothetical protein
MTVYDDIIALCEEMAEQGIKVTHKSILDRRGGSKRDVSRAVREFQALQQRRNLGQPVLPEIIGRLDPDTITDFVQRLTETEDLYIICPQGMQRSIEKIVSEILPAPHDNFLKVHCIRENEGSDTELPVPSWKSAIIVLVESSLPPVINFEKMFAGAVEMDLPVQLIQAVPSLIPDLPRGVQLHSLGLNLEKHGKSTRIFLAIAAFAEILIAARQLRDSA